MKFIILFVAPFLLIQHAYGEFSAAKYKEMHNVCVGKTGCSEDIIDRARKGDFTPDPAFKEFLKCLFEQEDALDATGNILVQRVLDSFHDDLVVKYGPAVKHCGETVSHAGDTHDYIYNFCYCAYEMTKEKFDIP